MAYTDDSMGPRRRALVDSLAGNTGVSGMAPGGAGLPPMSSDPSRQMGMAGVNMSDPRMTQMGSALPASGSSAPAAPAAPTYAPIAGFDFDKLSGKKAYDSKEKYSDAVRAFSTGLGSGVQVSRNNLGGMVDYAHGHGFGNAKSVGDDKIDFGDGAGPIDVVRSNGDLWFQNGPDRFAPAQGAALGGARPSFAGSTINPMLQGDAQSGVQSALQNMGALADPSRLQQLIAALGGGQQ